MRLSSTIKNIMEGEEGHPVLSIILLILSWFYWLGHWLRLMLYKTGILKTKTLPVPVISVGNITVGGTGKTPAVIMIANLMTEMGVKVAVLSRGYKGMAGENINLVSDGDKILMKPLQSGDEPYMIASRLKGIPVITGADRYMTGMYALEMFGIDAILIDDGYQHVRLNRKLNILLIDYNSPFGNGYLLPRGRLRESPSNINRSDVIILTKVNHESEISDIRLKSGRDIPICRSRYVSEGFFDMNSGRIITLSEARGKKGFAFCGIASPESFRNSLKEAGIEIMGFSAFDDHYQFRSEDMNSLIARARETGSEILITTEKDSVRLLELGDISFPVWFLKIGMDVFEGREILIAKIYETVKIRDAIKLYI